MISFNIINAFDFPEGISAGFYEALMMGIDDAPA